MTNKLENVKNTLDQAFHDRGKQYFVSSISELKHKLIDDYKLEISTWSLSHFLLDHGYKIVQTTALDSEKRLVGVRKYALKEDDK